MQYKLLHGDCLDEMKKMEDNSVDSIVTDPPYGLSFMGKKWDYDVPSQEIWGECLRVLKPGGYLLSFAGTRTQHRMAVRIEDAGFEIRDMIAWIYGSGFPKSLNVGKAVDKLQGNEREVVGDYQRPDGSAPRKNVTAKAIWGGADGNDQQVSKGTSPWEGWGTALKPALEPITVARKPLGEKTVAENVLTHGTGGLNIDGCRVPANWKEERPESWFNSGKSKSGEPTYGGNLKTLTETTLGERLNDAGRFPANLVHDGSEEVVGLFPESKSTLDKSEINRGTSKSWFTGDHVDRIQRGDSGSAARFFYCAKASKKDRDEGLEGFEGKEAKTRNAFSGLPDQRMTHEQNRLPSKNNHPTVKPTDLMRYLCRLVTPPGGIVLDPFMGSGSTGKAAKLEGFDFIGIEREAEYIEIAKARIEACK